jgi:hypothetical protein
MAGREEITAGASLTGGEIVNGRAPKARDTATVLEHYALGQLQGEAHGLGPAGGSPTRAAPGASDARAATLRPAAQTAGD